MFDHRWLDPRQVEVLRGPRTRATSPRVPSQPRAPERMTRPERRRREER